MKRLSGIALALITLWLPAAARAAYALNFNVAFTTEADTTTLIPGGSGAFTGFFSDLSPVDPSIGGGHVSFFAAGLGGQQGIYSKLAPTDPCRVDADLNTAIPGGNGNFTGFAGGPFASGQNVSFLGLGSGGQQGIYSRVFSPDPIVPPDPIRIADLTTPIPGGTGSFTSFSPFACMDGSAAAFVGSGSSGQSGIYTRATLCVPRTPN